MQTMRRVRNRRRGGFTLIEVLLVVAIIAMLAAFVVPRFMSTQRGAEVDICKTMVAKKGPIGGPLDLFYTAMGRYPKELSELVEKPSDDKDAAKWRGPYIDDASQLKDPWGNEIQYKFPGTKNEDLYDLWSYGPDGQDGTDDDIGNWRTEK